MQEFRDFWTAISNSSEVKEFNTSNNFDFIFSLSVELLLKEEKHCLICSATKSYL